MANTEIEYLKKTWNPIQTKIKGELGQGYHCTHVSEGCRHCWAEKMNNRIGNKLPFDNKVMKFEIKESELEKPLHWKKPQIVGVQFMGDLFHEQIPEEFIKNVYQTMIDCPQHTFLVLTKRPMRALEIVPKVLRTLFGNTLASNLPNVWLGVSVENQQTADERIPLLLQTPAAKRFISVEPLLGAIDLNVFVHKCLTPGCGDRVNWVIVGGESGHNVRPMHPDWVRKIKRCDY